MRLEWNLLHLTDLHFGALNDPDESLFHDDNKENIENEYRDSIIQQFHHILEGNGGLLHVDAVAVTGDITTRGSKDGFRLFAEITAPTLRPLVDSPEAICIVPGNHDVTWSLSRSHNDLFDQKFREFKTMVQRVGATSCLLPTGTVRDSAAAEIKFLTNRKPSLSPIFINKEKRLLILCINSAIRCGEINESRRLTIDSPINKSLREVRKLSLEVADVGIQEKLRQLSRSLAFTKKRANAQAVFDVAHVTQSQQRFLAKQLTRLVDQLGEEWNSFLRVAIMHHHVTLFDGQTTEHKPYDLITDASSVLGLLTAFNFNLILTGHKHQPYDIVHHYGDNKKLLVVGGPTVGGMPVRGGAQGFRHLNICADEGNLTVHLADVRLDAKTMHRPQSHIKECLASAKTIVIEETHSSRLCFMPAPKPITYDAAQDNSDDSLMFINVVSCRKAREQVKAFLYEQIQSGEIGPLSYVGLYDLYGHYDLLVRVDDASLSGENGVKLLSKIKSDLKRHNMVHEAGEYTTINLIDAHPFSGERSERRHSLFPSQQDYVDLRSHRAFILVTKTSNWNDDEIEGVTEMAKIFYQNNREKQRDVNDWAISWSERDIVIEILVRCGQYYTLQSLTRQLEELVDMGDRQKMTHIVYHHEEYCPLGRELITNNNCDARYRTVRL